MLSMAATLRAGQSVLTSPSRVTATAAVAVAVAVLAGVAVVAVVLVAAAVVAVVVAVAASVVVTAAAVGSRARKSLSKQGGRHGVTYEIPICRTRGI
jgi:Flp pilus assembly protein TadB